MLDTLSAKGHKMVLILDPHIKVDDKCAALPPRLRLPPPCAQFLPRATRCTLPPRATAHPPEGTAAPRPFPPLHLPPCFQLPCLLRGQGARPLRPHALERHLRRLVLAGHVLLSRLPLAGRARLLGVEAAAAVVHSVDARRAHLERHERALRLQRARGATTGLRVRARAPRSCARRPADGLHPSACCGCGCARR